MGCYKNIIDSLRLCGNGDDPVDECGQVNCVCHYGDRDPMCRQKIMYDAADAIEELLATVQKWISVEERLPRKYEEVITVDKHGRVQWNYLINEKHLTWSTGYHVTHWMPLPAAPKEELNKNVE